MIDLTLLRKYPEKISALIKKKDPAFNTETLVKLDSQRRIQKSAIEELQAKKKQLARAFESKDFTKIKEESKKISTQIRTHQAQFEQIEKDFEILALSCPNIIQDDVPEGNKESNVVQKQHKTKPTFDFTPLNHLELNKKNMWFNMEAGATIAGSGFVVYEEFCTKLTYALTTLMLKNNASFGFSPTLVPTLASERSLYNSGNLPKFAGDFYTIPEDGLCVIPTAEVSLTSLNSGKIFDATKLPVRQSAWTSCFRREAGGYGANERGLIRIHQFEKVELYSICSPENSNKELDYMVSCAESILQKLGLHYQISLLAAQDCSFSSSKTYDIEIWMPGQNRYQEVSSASNCSDFQARRASIRFRPEPQQKPHLVHTLNASSLSLPRLIVALMETYQQPDGSIQLPEILTKQMQMLW